MTLSAASLKSCLAFACVASGLMIPGCGGEAAPSYPKTYPVQGVVTYKGDPLDDAGISFVPDGGQQRGAVGRTNAEGKFTLMTFVAGDGALPGKYRVTITKSVVEGGQLTEDSSAPSGKTKYLVPAKYSDPSKSGLIATVNEKNENAITFEIND